MLCGEPRLEHAGRELTLSGWVGGRRDHGGLVFIDLRDRTGLVQLVMDPEHSPEAHAVAHALRLECVVRARGELVPRSEATRNPHLPTGEVELAVGELELLSASEVLPFQLDDEGVDEALRIRHRYLDLRRPRMQELQGIRTRAVRTIRRFLDERGFLDLETPTMTRATPEGARDFVIPFRLEPGTFYALPQSPQLYKQLLMCGGFDRYYQIARCWRDEAQRADRALEFTQLDVEMSFVEREDVLSLTEQLMAEVWREAGHEIELPFPRMPYGEALARYGTDKPDLRYGLEIGDVRASRSRPESACSRARWRGRRGALPRASPARLMRSRAMTTTSSRSSRRSGAGRGSRTSSSRPTGACARRSRNSSATRRSRPSARHPPRNRARWRSSRPMHVPSSSGCSAPFGRISRGASS
jgi:aspartyl-tRNA synthetase